MWFDYGGKKMFYEICGEGETIFFLHGWGCDNSIFSTVVENFSTTHQCVLLDFMGFGKSEEPNEAMSIPEYADSIMKLADYLKIEKFSVFSHSFGGRVSICLLNEEKKRVKAGVLISPAGVKDKFRISNKIKYIIFKFKKKFSKGNLERYYSIDYQNATEVMRKTLIKAVNFDQSHMLGEISQPVLILRGRNDTAVTEYMVTKMEQNIKNSQLKILNGGHFAFLTDKISFNLYIENFFNFL